MPYFSFLFPIFFIGMAVGVMYILAKKAWWGLAENYPFDRDFEGHRFGIISASINGVNYNIKMKLSTFKRIEQATMLGSRVKISY